MNKDTFLQELEYLLQDITSDEREDAIAFYRDYFVEAGDENEEQVLQDLKSPERLAALIKAGLSSDFGESMEYSEKGMHNAGYEQQDYVVIKEKERQEKRKTASERAKSWLQGDRDRNLILMAVIVVLAFIIGTPIFGVGIGAIISVCIGFCCLGIIFGAFGVALTIATCFTIIKGISILSLYPGAGLISIGGGIITLALAIFCFANMKWPFQLMVNVTKAIIEGIKKLFSKIGGEA